MEKFKVFVKSLLLYWAPPVVWAILIYQVSSNSVPVASKIDWIDFLIKKTAHIAEYFVLSTLTYRGLINSRVNKKEAGIVTIILTVIYAMSDEFHQSFSPTRTPRIRDVGFDTIGASLAIWTIWKLLPKAPQRLKRWAKKLELV